MSPVGVVAVATAVGLVAVWLVIDGLGGGNPSLASTLRSIRRSGDVVPPAPAGSGPVLVDRVGAVARRRAPVEAWSSMRPMLRVLDRPLDRHVGFLVVAALLGFVGPSVVALSLRAVGVVDGSVVPVIPMAAGLVGAVVAPMLVHSIAVERSAELRLDLRHQLSAFVDLVTMLLAGNTGHEGALRQAADAGDGRLFRELRRRMREASTTGRSMVDALDHVAVDLDLDELAQIAATTRLAAGEGAPVATTLAAKCSTLRSTLASDHEAQARIRTDKITPPLVGMTVLFMAVIIYPALTL